MKEDELDYKLIRLLFSVDMRSYDDIAKKIKALFPQQGVCADCVNYDERFTMCNTTGLNLYVIDELKFGCNQFKPKEDK